MLLSRTARGPGPGGYGLLTVAVRRPRYGSGVTVLQELDIPVVQAPMAGDPTTPELVAAVSAAGGLGFLAAGYKTPEAVEAQVTAVRKATDRPFGLNIFVPGGPVDTSGVGAYADSLAGEAARLGVAPGEPKVDDDAWAAKLALAATVPVAGFTFGCPTAAQIAALRAAGTLVVVTVTSPAEAFRAADAGADVLCVQGVEAGGHRGSFDGGPGELALLPLLGLVRAAVDLPLIAAGGIMTAAGVRAVLAAGAVAAQCGTAFLSADEAGTPAAHRAALVDPARATTLTRAFSGRWARGLTNRFTAGHPDAPPAYPAVHHLTSPLRKAAAAAGDPEAMALWAGQGHPLAHPGPAAVLLEELSP
jgi:nitronate monooxygenase